MNITELMSFKVGSIVTLSDLQTQAEFNKPKMDFKVKEVRNYDESNGIFNLVCYVLDGPNDTPYLLMVKKVGEAHDLLVYYLDTQGDAQDMGPVLSPDLKELAEKIQVTVSFKDGSVDVDWDRQNRSVKVDYKDSTGLTGTAVIADYATNADTRGNNRCWVSWIGDAKNGFIEMWYGALIKEYEVELFHVTK